MITKLSENIRMLRKSRIMTQEQLAEALGVTVGAVYKWESGRSVPDVELLMEIADFFCISMDVLLGYTMRDNDKRSIVKRLREYRHNRTPDSALEEAEKALQRYPNCFDVVYHSAQLYSVRGIDLQDERLSRRALELLHHACRLIDQNTDETISLLSIQIDIAGAHIAIGESDLAVELLKKHNPCRVNHPLIGCTLASACNRPDEAMPWLSMALLDSIVVQSNIVMGYINVFMKKQEFHAALDILKWHLDFLTGLCMPGKPSFLDKTMAAYLTICAEIHLLLEQPDMARAYLRRAKVIALAFDAAPNYDTNAVRFITGAENTSAHDNLGTTAIEGIRNLVTEDHDPAFMALWEEVYHEQE